MRFSELFTPSSKRIVNRRSTTARCRDPVAIRTATRSRRTATYRWQPWPSGARPRRCCRCRTSTSSSATSSRTTGGTRSAGKTRSGTTFRSTTVSWRFRGCPTGRAKARTGLSTRPRLTCSRTVHCSGAARGSNWSNPTRTGVYLCLYFLFLKIASRYFVII